MYRVGVGVGAPERKTGRVTTPKRTRDQDNQTPGRDQEKKQKPNPFSSNVSERFQLSIPPNCQQLEFISLRADQSVTNVTNIKTILEGPRLSVTKCFEQVQGQLREIRDVLLYLENIDFLYFKATEVQTVNSVKLNFASKKDQDCLFLNKLSHGQSIIGSIWLELDNIPSTIDSEMKDERFDLSNCNIEFLGEDVEDNSNMTYEDLKRLLMKYVENKKNKLLEIFNELLQESKISPVIGNFWEGYEKTTEIKEKFLIMDQLISEYGFLGVERALQLFSKFPTLLMDEQVKALANTLIEDELKLMGSSVFFPKNRVSTNEDFKNSICNPQVNAFKIAGAAEPAKSGGIVSGLLRQGADFIDSLWSVSEEPSTSEDGRLLLTEQ